MHVPALALLDGGFRCRCGFRTLADAEPESQQQAPWHVVVSEVFAAGRSPPSISRTSNVECLVHGVTLCPACNACFDGCRKETCCCSGSTCKRERWKLGVSALWIPGGDNGDLGCVHTVVWLPCQYWHGRNLMLSTYELADGIISLMLGFCGARLSWETRLGV